MDSFCCGCSLDFGIKLILLYQSLSCTFDVLSVLNSYVLEAKVFEESSPSSEAFNLFCALGSIPFILCGWSGVLSQAETHLRLYLAYLLANLGLDTGIVVLSLFHASCSQLPATGAGSAYACGTLRIFNFSYLSLWLILSVYCIFIVWSRCEQLQVGDTTEGFKAMAAESEAREQAALKKGMQYTGLFGVGPAIAAPQPLVYGSLASPVVDGSSKIFGRNHETEYPPNF